MSRRAELLRQRARLQERIAIQRLDLAEQFEPLLRAAESGQHRASQVGAIVDYLKSHPLLIAGAVSALAMLKPAMAGRWLLRGAGVWRTWRVVRNLKALIPASLFSRWF
ncbi:MAG: hypothetical protein EOO28_19905 [Comamonadaceae bacterium]|nr:MAG: hypothetical protein EOO28_19905 [Comamonadaceae bacterium]